MLSGASWLIGIYLVVVVLHVLLPGRWVEGYALGEGRRRLRYRLNGLPVLVVVAAAYVGLATAGVIAPDALYPHRYVMLATACVVGLVFTAVVVLPAPADGGRSLAADLFLGRRENPQWLGQRVDAKMLLYLIG